jgi:hypothetical protein
MVRGSFFEATRRHGLEITPLMTQPLEAELFRATFNLQRNKLIPEGLVFRLEFDDAEVCHLMPANPLTWNYLLGN